jgi:hypothetical protein
MTTVDRANPRTFVVHDGETLTVQAGATSHGCVWLLADVPVRLADVGPGTSLPITRGGTYRVESVTGPIECELTASVAEAPAPAPVVPPDISKGRQAMALNEKFARLAQRANAVPKKLEEQADSLFLRLDAVEQRGAEAFDNMHRVLQDVEAGVTAAEGAVRELSNGGPPLGGSSA